MSDARDMAVAAVFDRAAEVYDTAIPFFARFGKRLVELADVRPGESVLDLASGRGACLRPAAEAVGTGGRVVGVDLAPKMVELLREDLQRLGLRQSSAMVGDATHLDLADNEFDVALCGFTLMLLHDPKRAAAELIRVLRPGGRVAVSMPTGAGPEWSFFGEIAAQFAPRAVRPLPPALRAPVDLAALLREVGFHDIRSLDEAEDFTFTDADEWWRWVWSQGMRVLLEALPPDALDDLRAAAEERLQTMMRDGSIPLRQYVRYTLGIKP
jgi:ubiquinone/menaquinone biosynthesis C-methylase UbiE